MKKHRRVPYARVATDEDKRLWNSVFASVALVGFVQVMEMGITHWAAIVRHGGILKRHTLHGLCGRDMVERPTPGAEVNCMTCIVRNANGPRGLR